MSWDRSTCVKGKVQWGDPGGSGQLVGNYFGHREFGKAADPQCAAVAVDLRELLHASGGHGRNDRPDSFFRIHSRGQEGPLAGKRSSCPEPGAFDGNHWQDISDFDESRSVQVRFDATNVLNHPMARNAESEH